MIYPYLSFNFLGMTFRIHSISTSSKTFVKAESYETLLELGCTKLKLDKENVELKIDGDFVIDDADGYDFAKESKSIIYFCLPGESVDIQHGTAPTTPIASTSHTPTASTSHTSTTPTTPTAPTTPTTTRTRVWPLVYQMPYLPDSLLQVMQETDNGKKLRCDSTFVNSVMKVIFKDTLQFVDPKAP